MAYKFLEIASTPSVKAAQAANGSAAMWAGLADSNRDFDRFDDDARAFIAARDSFYMATVSETGWPYMQHRGGPPGFLEVLDDTTLGFADFRGNRQYITVGNAAVNDKVCLFLMDYPHRARLKIFGHLRMSNDPALIARVTRAGYKAKVERAMTIELESFDWNCPQHITPRYSAAELEAMR
jgi:predicted pyridoxine 5'-phosphate oxidase superfamily flavin-nucleotide-binding protein